MKELEVLEDMITSTLDKKFEYSKNEFLNQLTHVAKAITTKDKEILLKEEHIKQLENKCKDLESVNEDNKFKANMYKSMIQGIFNSI